MTTATNATHETESTESTQTIKQFISSHQVIMVCRRVDKRPDSLMSDLVRHFNCKVIYDGRRFSLYFSQGSAHTQPPTMADVLDSCAGDAQYYDNARDFSDFCAELGYSDDSMSAYRNYKACKKMRDDLTRVFGAVIYDELMECERL